MSLKIIKRVYRRGNSLALPLTGVLKDALPVKPDTDLDIEVTDTHVIIERPSTIKKGKTKK